MCIRICNMYVMFMRIFLTCRKAHHEGWHACHALRMRTYLHMCLKVSVRVSVCLHFQFNFVSHIPCMQMQGSMCMRLYVYWSHVSHFWVSFVLGVCMCVQGLCVCVCVCVCVHVCMCDVCGHIGIIEGRINSTCMSGCTIECEDRCAHACLVFACWPACLHAQKRFIPHTLVRVQEMACCLQSASTVQFKNRGT
jgi:hypothetical protein